MKLWLYISVSEKSKSQSKKETEKTKDEPSSIFQRQRVDMLLGELLRKFPPPLINQNPSLPEEVTVKKEVVEDSKAGVVDSKAADDFKSPEKKMKIN